MSPYRERSFPDEKQLVVDKKGKPTTERWYKKTATETAVNKFLDAEGQAKERNKNRSKKKPKFSAQDILHEEAIRESVRGLSFHKNPDGLLNGDDFLLLENTYRAHYELWDGREGGMPQLPLLIHGFVDGQKIILDNYGVVSYEGDRKLGREEAINKFKNLAVLIKQRDKDLAEKTELNPNK